SQGAAPLGGPPSLLLHRRLRRHTTSCKARSRISRSTVQRVMSKPSRCICHHTLRAPWTLNWRRTRAEPQASSPHRAGHAVTGAMDPHATTTGTGCPILLTTPLILTPPARRQRCWQPEASRGRKPRPPVSDLQLPLKIVSKHGKRTIRLTPLTRHNS